MKKLLLLLLIITGLSYSQTRYLDANSPDTAGDGLSWETAWKSFSQFNINTDVPDNGILKIAPGIYEVGQSVSYYSQGCFLWVRNKKHLTIEKSDPSGIETNGAGFSDGTFTLDSNPVILRGNATYKYGIVLAPADSVESVCNIEIKGITFRKFGYNSIKTRGYVDNIVSPYVKNVSINGCTFDSTLGIPGQNSASIKLQLTDSVVVENCYIFSASSDSTENDGIYIDDTKNIIIKNNSITVFNSINVIDSLQPHVDCIQATYSKSLRKGSSNLVVENNILKNTSNIDSFYYRQIIYADSIQGFIRIANNILVSEKGNGLINIHLQPVTDSVRIYNNTLVGKGNQEQLVNIENENSNISVFKIKNNILYKTGGTNFNIIRFANDSLTSLSNGILNNNLYYLTNGTTPQILFSNAHVNWNSDPNRFEKYGVMGDPLFQDITTNNFKLKDTSITRNNGTGLLSSGISFDYYGNSRPYWDNEFDIGAYELEDFQIRFGLTNADYNTIVYDTLTAIGSYWIKNVYGNWVLSTDQTLSKAIDSSKGPSSSEIYRWGKGVRYSWLDKNNSTGKRIAAGFYKVTNSNGNAYFYIDLRDAVSNYKLNLYFQYDVRNNRYNYYQDGLFKNIDSAEVIRIWTINNGTPKANIFGTSYWENALLQLNTFGQNPRLVWGPLNPNYVLERKIGPLSSWVSLSSIDTLEKIDSTIVIGSPEVVSTQTWYRVKNNNNNYTNQISLLKQNIEKSNFSDEIINFRVNQNYPNPFNPTTQIVFTIPEIEQVVLKIYDVLGSEVSTLINQKLDPGEHQIKFDGSGLSSGVYFYRITAGRYSEVKKMQIIK